MGTCVVVLVGCYSSSARSGWLCVCVCVRARDGCISFSGTDAISVVLFWGSHFKVHERFMIQKLKLNSNFFHLLLCLCLFPWPNALFAYLLTRLWIVFLWGIQNLWNLIIFSGLSGEHNMFVIRNMNPENLQQETYWNYTFMKTTDVHTFKPQGPFIFVTGVFSHILMLIFLLSLQFIED